MNSLEGSLDIFVLSDVFRLLARAGVSGALSIEREGASGTVYFAEGAVSHASSSLSREYLGQRLVNAKLITQGQLVRALEDQKRMGDARIGDVLAKKGVIEQDALEDFLTEEITNLVCNLLEWETGSFSFSAEAPVGESAATVSVESMILEASRRLEEWDVIRRKIPTSDLILSQSPSPGGETTDINVNREEWRLLILADGTRSVAEIAESAEVSEFEASKMLYGLLAGGLLEVASTTHVPRGDSRPVVEEPKASMKSDKQSSRLPPSTTNGKKVVARGHANGKVASKKVKSSKPAADRKRTKAKPRRPDPTLTQDVLERVLASVKEL